MHYMDLNSLLEHGLEDLLRQTQGDHTLFIKYSFDGDYEIGKLTLKKKLTIQFEMKELGKLKYLLGIEVAYSKQMNYVLDLLKETKKLICKTSRVPIEQNHKIECEESPTIKKSQC
ncbi:hypothetical protein CR513_43011, partial [Mucuna pruriens]